MGHNRIAGSIVILAAAVVYSGSPAGTSGALRPDYFLPALFLCIMGLVLLVQRGGGGPSS